MSDDLVARLRDRTLQIGCSNGYAIEHEAADEIVRLRQRLKLFEGALKEALDYLDNHADVVDGDDGVPQANSFMSFATSLRVRMGEWP